MVKMNAARREVRKKQKQICFTSTIKLYFLNQRLLNNNLKYTDV